MVGFCLGRSTELDEQEALSRRQQSKIVQQLLLPPHGVEQITVHTFEADWFVGEQRGNMICRDKDVFEANTDERTKVGALDQPQLGPEDDRAGAFTSYQGAGYIEAAFGEELVEDGFLGGDASLDGLWMSRRIVLSDTLIAGATSGETRFYIALEAARAAHGDPLRALLFDTVVTVLGIALAVFVADRLWFRRDDDEVSRLALMGALLGCAYLVVMPLYNVGARAMEGQAAVSAMAATGDRPSAVRAAVRAADQNMLAVCPGTFASLYFADTPAVATLVSAYNGSAPSCK